MTLAVKGLNYIVVKRNADKNVVDYNKWGERHVLVCKLDIICHHIVLLSFFFSGPAPEKVTDTIYEITQKITEYKTCPDITCDIETIAVHKFQVCDWHILANPNSVFARFFLKEILSLLFSLNFYWECAH
jgi:hypothetical protein